MKDEKGNLFSVRSLVFMALFAAIICVAAPYSIPVGPIPVTLATFAIYLTGTILGAKRGMISVIVYILLGAVGLPVFSNFAGGFQKLLGVTGGYIIGYIPLVLIVGIFADMKTKKHWTMIIGMILGTVALYAFGTAWFMIMTGTDLVSALGSCVIPFLPGDGIKIACVTAIALPMKSKLNNAMFGTLQNVGNKPKQS